MAPAKRLVPFEYYVLSELHHYSDAFGMAFGGGSGMTRPKTEPNRWLSGHAYRFEVTTQSIKPPDSSTDHDQPRSVNGRARGL